MYQLTRTGLSFGHAYRLWLYPDGAGVYGAGGVGGGCRASGDRWRAAGPTGGCSSHPGIAQDRSTAGEREITMKQFAFLEEMPDTLRSFIAGATILNARLGRMKNWI